MKTKNISVVHSLGILLCLFILSGCPSETVRMLKSVKKGMSIEHVRQLAGNEIESKIIEDKTYYLFTLFEDQSSKYFGMPSYYIVVAKDDIVLEWGPYNLYFAPQKRIWTLKEN